MEIAAAFTAIVNLLAVLAGVVAQLAFRLRARRRPGGPSERVSI
jgi:hypothetical protein